MEVRRPTFTILPGDRLWRPDAAAYLGCKSGTLAVWAHEKRGPPFFILGGRAYYRLADLDAYIREAAGDLQDQAPTGGEAA
jgi:hypothetical protein